MKINNVKIVNFDSTIENANITFEDGIITEIEEIKGTPEAILVPGFIDTHIHGFYNHDVMDGISDLEIVSQKLAENGTTSFMPTAMTRSWSEILNSLNQMSKAKKFTARNLGLHIEGPFIGEAKKGAHKTEYLLKGTEKRIERMYLESRNKLKKISFDPTVVSLDVMKYMLKLDIIPSIGHSAATFELSKEFFDNGCTSVCHLWNAMSGVDSRNPGMLQAALMNENAYVELICDLFHVSKESILFTIHNKGVDKIMCISDAIKPAYYEDGDNISGNIPVTKEGLAIYLKGTKTIAGSGIALIDAFRNLIKIGISLEDAVAMTSYNAAKYLKKDKLGYISKDKFADFVLLEPKEFKILNVYINGNEIRRTNGN
ncbi:N-acetylglucosamine-6-phosphate deacetylase [Mycoplasma buteonis]|uniref:N-acetylglucosamine-6-phosphate deacetylase n=1 Tax=Mycoplasma buteonis TaxID=171280 RepID=UPI000559DFD0|nr:N-acetylglucosamine-6-phosphate deacetylase [Mycoplasma buteonis]